MAKNNDPYLEPSVQGYIVKVARKNFWKVASWYEFDDLVQDGYLCYAKCRARFRGNVEPTKEDRKTFMSYFQMAFSNHITDLQQDPRSRQQEVGFASLSDKQVETFESWTESAADLGQGTLATLLAQAPAEILDILKQILVDGVAEVPFLRTRLHKKLLPNSPTPRIVKGRRHVRETTVEHYDRCLGKVGVVEQLRNYFLNSATG